MHPGSSRPAIIPVKTTRSKACLHMMPLTPPLKAIVIGATGATGAFLVDALLEDPDYSGVTIFVRRPSGKQHPKLQEHVIDFSRLSDYASLINGDVLFSTLGTTLKAAGSKEKQWQIDYEIPAQLAQIAKENHVRSMVLLSAANANPKSPVFYSRMKGALEEKIAALGFEQYIIFRPGLLKRPHSDRAGEKFAVSVLEGLNKLGILKKYRPLPTKTLAEKLAKAPRRESMGRHVVGMAAIFNY